MFEITPSHKQNYSLFRKLYMYHLNINSFLQMHLPSSYRQPLELTANPSHSEMGANISTPTFRWTNYSAYSKWPITSYTLLVWTPIITVENNFQNQPTSLDTITRICKAWRLDFKDNWLKEVLYCDTIKSLWMVLDLLETLKLTKICTTILCFEAIKTSSSCLCSNFISMSVSNYTLLSSAPFKLL